MFLAPGASWPGCASWLFAVRTWLPGGLDRLFLPNYNFCTLSTNTAPFLLLSIDRADLAWKSSPHKKIMPAGLIFRWLAEAPLKKSYARESRKFGSLAADFEHYATMILEGYSSGRRGLIANEVRRKPSKVRILYLPPFAGFCNWSTAGARLISGIASILVRIQSPRPIYEAVNVERG